MSAKSDKFDAALDKYTAAMDRRRRAAVHLAAFLGFVAGTFCTAGLQVLRAALP